jgi:hypothetical protein
VFVFFAGGCFQPPCPPEELSVSAGSIGDQTLAIRSAFPKGLDASWDLPSIDAAGFDTNYHTDFVANVRATPRQAPEELCPSMSASWCAATTHILKIRAKANRGVVEDRSCLCGADDNPYGPSEQGLGDASNRKIENGLASPSLLLRRKSTVVGPSAASSAVEARSRAVGWKFG